VAAELGGAFRCDPAEGGVGEVQFSEQEACTKNVTLVACDAVRFAGAFRLYVGCAGAAPGWTLS
jgi:hypothetical protein